MAKKFKTTKAQRDKLKEKRTALKQISDNIRMLQEMGEFPHFNTMNEAIVEYYKQEQNDSSLEFKTFMQWKEEGFTVIKGQKGFVVWGRKKQSKKEVEEEKAEEQEATSETEKKELEFFPISHVFSSAQVQKLENK